MTSVSKDEAAARGLGAPGAALPIGSISPGPWPNWPAAQRMPENRLNVSQRERRFTMS